MRYGSIGLYLLLLNWPLKPQLLDKSGEIFWTIKSHIIWLFNHARKRLFIHFFNRQRVVGGICTPHVYMTVININSLDSTVYLIYPVNIDIISVSYYDVQKHHSGLCATTWSQEWRNARHRSEITRRHSCACGRRGAELITTATSSRAGLRELSGCSMTNHRWRLRTDLCCTQCTGLHCFPLPSPLTLTDKSN